MTTSLTEKPILRPVAWVFGKPSEPLFYERSIRIEIEDEAGGEFLVITSQDDSERRGFAIDKEEWPALRDAIDQAMKEVR